MSRITPRLALTIVLAAPLIPAAAFAQSQDTQSVAEAARRAREQKKTPAKPAKVITEDDVKPAAQPNPANPASPASADTGAASGTPASSASSTATVVSAPAAGSSTAPDAKKESKEVTELRAQIKQALADLDLVLREKTLENEKYYTNTDYVHDAAGKQKLDELVQEAIDKQQILDRLKARLVELLPASSGTASTPPKP